MADFDETKNQSVQDAEIEADEHSKALENTKCVFTMILKKLVFFVSFGPGVLGVVWLIGRILRR